MKQINIREALLELDRKTDARYDLTTLYEACKLDDDDKQKLVKYIDAYDHPATINKFLSSKCDAITEALGDDDVSDMKVIDEINDGGDRTLWNLMNKFEDEDLQLKELTEDVDPEVLQGRLDNIDYAMNHYVKDSFLIDDVQGSGKDWKVTYNDVTVDVTFDTDWEEYTYYINGKGPYAHSSYEYIASDVANFVDYNHLGQSDDEVDEALGDNRDVHSRTHMDSYDVYCTDCGQVTSHRFKGNFKDGEKELGRYICKECGCENDDDPINESLTENKDGYSVLGWLSDHETAYEDAQMYFDTDDLSTVSESELIGWISDHDQLYDDYKTFFKVDENLNEGVDTSNLESQIKEVVTAVMQENGYEADEIEAYTAVEIKDTADDMIQVEVRAELGYDDLMDLCDKLNYIVEEIDPKSYFEPVTSGIARAFIRNDQSQDIVDEEAVNQWTNKIYDCASMEDLRQVWTAFKDHIDNGQYTDGTVDAVLDEIHKKADMLNESLTEDTSEWFVGDSETGHMYKGKDAAQKVYDELVKSGVKDAVMKPAEDASLTEGYNQGDWVEVNLNTKKNGTPNIIPVKVDSGHGKTFLGWAWGERQHEYPMSAIVKKIDMDDTDAIIRKYTPSGYMSEKLTLNESDDTDILYDMEDYDEDNTTVTAGNSFIEDGHTWTWFRQCGDTVHLDFDNWAVWWAYRPEVEDDYNSTAISGFFVVDTDTGFIDWGPCDTVKEAQEFLQSKVNDWENDDLDESKSINESADTMIYLFPELTDEDLDAAKGYGLQFLGKNHGPDGSEDNWVLKGYESSLRMFADKYLGYELHPDYLYAEEDFAGDIVNEAVDHDINRLRDAEGHLLADKWYAETYPDDAEGAEQLKGITMDAALEDRSVIDNCSDVVKERVNKQLDKYTGRLMTEDVNSAANSLFDLLKDYGAISVDKDVDVTRISFRNSEDDSDATLVHHCILSKGYKELTQYGNNPNVTEYMNEAGDTCVKLLIYDDSIAVEVSAEDASQYINVDESLKEGVEKYIIIAKEDGLNLYYNATDDNFETDMKAATQYEERAVALDDYKAIKERYPNAYIRSMYDLPLLNKPSKKEGFEEDEWDDDELASIYGGDTKNDIPDGVETPEETEARLAKENALKESTKYVVVKADGTYAGVPCETEEEARELSNQHEGSKVHKIEG